MLKGNNMLKGAATICIFPPPMRPMRFNRDFLKQSDSEAIASDWEAIASDWEAVNKDIIDACNELTACSKLTQK